MHSWKRTHAFSGLPTNPNDPVPVLDGVVTKGSGAVEFELAGDGSLVYVAGSGASGGMSVPVWVDHQGTEVPLDIPARTYRVPRLSPDETRLAVFIVGENNSPDVWVSEVARGTLERLDDNPAPDIFPVWTPDGERIVFASQRDGSWGLFRVSADGTGDVEHLITLDDATSLRPYSWSVDGSRLVFEHVSPDATGRNIGVLSLDDEPTWAPLLAPPTGRIKVCKVSQAESTHGILSAKNSMTYITSATPMTRLLSKMSNCAGNSTQP